MILTTLEIEASEFERRTGWAVKPEGACLGDVCVPLPEAARNAAGRLDATVVAEGLGMPLVTDEEHGLIALGPPTTPSGHALPTAVAPDLELPDALTGEPFRLSSLRGRKVLLVAWASW